MTTVFLGIGFLALFFILMSVRLLFLKNGEFKGTCASQSPFLSNADGSCSYCGKTSGSCKADDEPQNEVDKVLASS
ncbi:MAG: hypothetical protein AB8B61_02735 [Cyclobacteriaceae bacterium]